MTKKDTMRIQIKQDAHAVHHPRVYVWAVYVDGKVHRTGFSTRRAAEKWAESTVKICQYCDAMITNPIWVQRSECMYPICSECKDRYPDRFTVVIDGAVR